MTLADTADDATNASQRGGRAKAYTYLAEADITLAASRNTPPAEIRQHWSAACDMFQRSVDIWVDMRRRGILSVTDAGKPDEVARELARCQEMLRKTRSASGHPQ